MQGLVGKPQGKRPLGRPMRRGGDKIKLRIQEWYVDFLTESNWFRIGASGGHL